MDSCPSSETTDFVVYVTASAVILAATGSALLAGWFTRRAKISEFRQGWINDLRSDIADFLSAMRRYHQTHEDTSLRSDAREEELRKLRHEIDPIYNRIVLRINPRKSRNKKQDDEFLDACGALFKTSLPEKYDCKWQERLNSALTQARELLKREWEVTKNPLLTRLGPRGGALFVCTNSDSDRRSNSSDQR